MTEDADRRKEFHGYTRRPQGPLSGGPDKVPTAVFVAAAAALIWGAAYFLPTRPPVPDSPAASAATAAAPAIATPATTPADSVGFVKQPDAKPAPGPRYLNEGMYGDHKLPEPEDSVPRTHNCSNYFDARQDGYPVVGDAVDVTIDGIVRRVKLVPGAEPGIRKAVVLVPEDGRVHRVVYAVSYDLGPEGQVPVTESVLIDKHGDRHYDVWTPVDRASFESGQGRRAVKLKN